MHPESGADLDHCALPTIQAANRTHDPQTGDISAVLHRNKGCGEQTESVEAHETPMNH